MENRGRGGQAGGGGGGGGGLVETKRVETIRALNLLVLKSRLYKGSKRNGRKVNHGT